MRYMLEGYKNKLIGYIRNIDTDEILKVAKIIKKTALRGNKIFIIGNGGSIATAIHFSEDMLLNTNLKTIVVRLDNVSVITAVSNDYSYEDVFVRQLENLFDEGDLLVSISASGLSPNLVKAIEYVDKLGSSVSISGFHGGQTRKKAMHNVFVETRVGSYEETEDLHLIICHMITKCIKENIV